MKFIQYQKRIVPVLLLILSGCATTPQKTGVFPIRRENPGELSQQANKESAGFVLGAGDSVSIKVWRNDDLNAEVRIDPDGNITLPGVGVLSVDGKSPSEVSELLTQKLTQHLVNPRVSVNVGSLASRKVFVLGEVRSPGSFSLAPQMSLVEVIATAGGFTHDANTRNVLLARQGKDSITVSALDISPKGDDFALGFSAPLNSRDMIYVLPRRIASIERFMTRFSNILSPIIGVESAIVLGDDAWNVLSGESRGSSVLVTK